MAAAAATVVFSVVVGYSGDSLKKALRNIAIKSQTLKRSRGSSVGNKKKTGLCPISHRNSGMTLVTVKKKNNKTPRLGAHAVVFFGGIRPKQISRGPATAVASVLRVAKGQNGRTDSNRVRLRAFPPLRCVHVYTEGYTLTTTTAAVSVRRGVGGGTGEGT